MKYLYTSFLFSIFSFQILAGGFQVNLQGQRSAGMGHTGTGMKLGAASAFFNPGALSFANTEILIGINLIFSKVGYREVQPGVYTAESTSGVGTPFHGHIAIKPTEDSPLVFGLSAYTPFGSGISYQDDWKGQFLLREMSLRAIFYQGTVSYKINEKLGIGAGYVLATGDFSLRRGIPVQNSTGSYGEANLRGNGIGHGFNVGMFYELSDQVSMGLSYRSGVQVNLDGGDAQFDVPESLSENFPTTTFNSKIRLPSVTNFGISIKASEKTLFNFDVNYVTWSSYDTLSFDFEENTDNLEDADSPRNYKNVVIVRAGMEHQINDQLVVRGGAYYDFTPVQDGYMTPETPDMNKLGITAGASYTLKNFQIDASLMYIYGKERQDTNFETGFSGRWTSTAIIPGVSFSYKL
ncbi:MAG: outer membrane protein transport protein [Brumimicrobium sp.]|nr:outer membrane protein transport protein [Brumimicrobium sp.]